MPVEWGGGGGGSVGGIEATVSLDTSGIDPGIAGLKAKLAELGGRLEALGPQSATATRAVAANMDRVGQTANAAGFRMQTFAQTLDDLQYVGEQGLRPILNNLIQISPALGVAALAVDQLVKSMGGWKEVLSDLGVISPIETAAEEMKRLGDLTARTANEQDRLNRLKRGEAATESIRTAETPAEKATAGAVQAAIAGADFRKVRDMVAEAQEKPRTTAEDAAALERERAFRANPFARIPGGLFGYGLKEQVGMGVNLAGGYGTDAQKAIADRQAREANANAERLLGEATLPGAAGMAARQQLEKYAREAGGAFAGLGEKIKAAAPDTLGRPGETPQEKLHRLGQQEKAAEDARKADLDASLPAALGRVEHDRGAQAEREKLNAAGKDRFDREAKAIERGGDLNWRLRLLTNPEKEGRSMSLDAYEQSIKSRTGETEEAKRLHAIQELLKDIKENNMNIKIFAVKKKG